MEWCARHDSNVRPPGSAAATDSPGTLTSVVRFSLKMSSVTGLGFYWGMAICFETLLAQWCARHDSNVRPPGSAAATDSPGTLSGAISSFELGLLQDGRFTGVWRSALKHCLRSGAPGTIRTCDRLVRSQVLYPAELRALKAVRLLQEWCARHDSNVRPPGS